MRPWWSTLGIIVVATGCGESSTAPDEPAEPPGQTCVETETELPDGRCIRPGVPPGGCSDGFEHDGAHGCEPVVPSDPCPPGTMAVPGDTACRLVAECGEGQWGDIPRDGATQHVDASFIGISDGTEAAPWTTIAQAVVAAAPGATVAVARGTYVEDVVVSVPVTLWGVCPSEVEIVGLPGGQPGTLTFLATSAGSQVQAVGVSGPQAGIILRGAHDVTVDSLWAHDLSLGGVVLLDHVAGMTLSNSLLEHIAGAPVTVFASEIAVTGVEIRDVTVADGLGARGMTIQTACTGGVCEPTPGSRATIRRSRIERVLDSAVFGLGSELDVEGLLIRDVAPNGLDVDSGHGIAIQGCHEVFECAATTRPPTRIVGSVVERARHSGIVVYGTDAQIANTVVRGAEVGAGVTGRGAGMAFQVPCNDGECGTETPAVVTVTDSVIERTVSHGILVNSSQATIERVVVDGVVPRTGDGQFGRGIGIQPVNGTTNRSALVLRDSLVVESSESGVFVLASDADISGVAVLDTNATGLSFERGNGIVIQATCTFGMCSEPATATITNVAIERSRQLGLLAMSSSCRFEDSLVSRTAPAPSGLFGNGVAVVQELDGVRSEIARVVVRDNALAGVTLHGASVDLEEVSMQCNAFDLAGEPYLGRAIDLTNRGGNRCGCPNADSECKLQTGTGVAPPDPLSPATVE